VSGKLKKLRCLSAAASAQTKIVLLPLVLA
jgi:hypothetical protein